MGGSKRNNLTAPVGELMNDMELWKYFAGGGSGALLVAGLIRLASAIWLKDAAQRADLSGNMTSISNMTVVNASLLKTIDTLNEQIARVSKERDDYRSRYLEHIGKTDES